VVRWARDLAAAGCRWPGGGGSGRERAARWRWLGAAEQVQGRRLLLSAARELGGGWPGGKLGGWAGASWRGRPGGKLGGSDRAAGLLASCCEDEPGAVACWARWSWELGRVGAAWRRAGQAAGVELAWIGEAAGVSRAGSTERVEADAIDVRWKR
jgi:hypothetical protein